jgi:hypothetical protein
VGIIINQYTTMNRIKDQVDSIIKFTATTFEALSEERSTIQDRIIEGVEKMKESSVFSEAEIKEVSQYAVNTLNTRYSSAKADITNNIRDSFEF